MAASTPAQRITSASLIFKTCGRREGGRQTAAAGQACEQSRVAQVELLCRQNEVGMPASAALCHMRRPESHLRHPSAQGLDQGRGFGITLRLHVAFWRVKLAGQLGQAPPGKGGRFFIYSILFYFYLSFRRCADSHAISKRGEHAAHTLQGRVCHRILRSSTAAHPPPQRSLGEEQHCHDQHGGIDADSDGQGFAADRHGAPLPRWLRARRVDTPLPPPARNSRYRAWVAPTGRERRLGCLG